MVFNRGTSGGRVVAIAAVPTDLFPPGDEALAVVGDADGDPVADPPSEFGLRAIMSRRLIRRPRLRRLTFSPG